MEWLGLDIAIWIVVLSYFCGMLIVGWWIKHNVKSQEEQLEASLDEVVRPGEFGPDGHPLGKRLAPDRF